MMFSRTLAQVTGLAASRTFGGLSFDYDAYALQVTVANASTLTAQFDVEISNDGTNWATHPDFTLSLTGNGTQVLRDWAAQYRFMRPKFTRTAGSCDLLCIFVAKGEEDRGNV